MDNTVAISFYPDEDSPLIQYEIAFQKKPKLLAAGVGAFGGSSYASKIITGPTETLEDDIKWEPHIDEADKLDYIVAVSSGVLAGLIDVYYVGEFSLDRANEWGKDKIEKVVMKVARVEGYTGDDLNDAIKTLEKNHPLAADGNTNDFGGGLQHHLRDFSHHFSIGGLFSRYSRSSPAWLWGPTRRERCMSCQCPSRIGHALARTFRKRSPLELSAGSSTW